MSATTYAKSTTVTAEKSRMEIETLVNKHGATEFATRINNEYGAVAFSLHERNIRFLLPLPARSEFERDHNKYIRTDVQITKHYDAAVRQRWRALLINIKAKLAAIEAGIETVDDAFMAHIVMPGGKTVSEVVTPEIARSYAEGTPPLLTFGG